MKSVCMVQSEYDFEARMRGKHRGPRFLGMPLTSWRGTVAKRASNADGQIHELRCLSLAVSAAGCTTMSSRTLITLIGLPAFLLEVPASAQSQSFTVFDAIPDAQLTVSLAINASGDV